MIEKLYSEEQGRIGTIAEKINEIIDAINGSMESDTGASDWYITGAHARRAVGYLCAVLVTQGHLPKDFDFAWVADIWAKALEATMSHSDEDPSPIGVSNETRP